jgi:CRP-like cAMP-binding protein
MYLPLHGRIVARKPDGTRVADVELGGVIGQESILTGVPSPITVEAVSDALILCMPAVAMNDLLVQLPNVVAHIRTHRSSSSGSGQRHLRVSSMVL